MHIKKFIKKICFLPIYFLAEDNYKYKLLSQ